MKWTPGQFRHYDIFNFLFHKVHLALKTTKIDINIANIDILTDKKMWHFKLQKSIVLDN